jgi:predicted  nucleic acid-binding Zn-ribbon protein
MALKASPADQALLLDLQALDTLAAQLEHRGKSLPEHATITDLAKQAEALRLTLAEQSGTVEDARAELKRVESDVEVVEARITRDSDRLQSSSSVKDVTALDQELTALRSRLNDLEEIELTVMQQVEDREGEAASTSDQLEAVRSRLGESEVARDAALAGINAERSAAEAARAELAARIPGDVLALYEKQRARYGTGASMLRGGVSLASGVRLHENELQAVRNAAPDDVLICPSSEAILVRTDESGL